MKQFKTMYLKSVKCRSSTKKCVTPSKFFLQVKLHASYNNVLSIQNSQVLIVDWQWDSQDGLW